MLFAKQIFLLPIRTLQHQPFKHVSSTTIVNMRETKRNHPYKENHHHLQPPTKVNNLDIYSSSCQMFNIWLLFYQVSCEQRKQCKVSSVILLGLSNEWKNPWPPWNYCAIWKLGWRARIKINDRTNGRILGRHEIILQFRNSGGGWIWWWSTHQNQWYQDYSTKCNNKNLEENLPWQHWQNFCMFLLLSLLLFLLSSLVGFCIGA